MISLIFWQHCLTFYPQCLQEHLQHACIFISSEHMQRAILSQCMNAQVYVSLSKMFVVLQW